LKKHPETVDNDAVTLRWAESDRWEVQSNEKGGKKTMTARTSSPPIPLPTKGERNRRRSKRRGRGGMQLKKAKGEERTGWHDCACCV